MKNPFQGKKPFEGKVQSKTADSNAALRKLSRKDLLRLLIEQMEENEALRTQLDEANAQLESREIIKESAGSIAEVAIMTSGVIGATEKAAALYLENIKRMEAELKLRLDEVRSMPELDNSARGRHAAR